MCRFFSRVNLFFGLFCILHVLSGPLERLHHQLKSYQQTIIPQWPQYFREII